MKTLTYTFGLLLLGTLGLMAQSTEEMEGLFKKIANQGDNFHLSISHALIRDLDFDFDLEEYTEQISGNIDKIRFVRFKNYASGLRSEKEFVEQMLKWGYRQAKVPSENDDDAGQLILLRKPNGKSSPHAAMLINNPNDKNAILLVFSGDLIFKTN